MKNLKIYELPRIDIQKFSGENIVTDSGIITSLQEQGFTADNTVRVDFRNIVGFSD